MITGYNTDVEYGGVVYHVQTEDKGLEKPFILSLVYAGGEILASKRSPYDDLIQNGFNEAVLSERLQRQHKLICAAVHAGRLDELKQMTQREGAARTPVAIVSTPVPSAVEEPVKSAHPSQGTSREAPTRISIFAEPLPDSLQVNLLNEPALTAGESVTLRVEVVRGAQEQRRPVYKARLLVRILGSTFRPTKIVATSDKNGLAEITVSIPEFKRGRAAMLVRAESDKEVAELRRIIQPAK